MIAIPPGIVSLASRDYNKPEVHIFNARMSFEKNDLFSLIKTPLHMAAATIASLWGMIVHTLNFGIKAVFWPVGCVVAILTGSSDSKLAAQFPTIKTIFIHLLRVGQMTASMGISFVGIVIPKAAFWALPRIGVDNSAAIHLKNAYGLYADEIEEAADVKEEIGYLKKQNPLDLSKIDKAEKRAAELQKSLPKHVEKMVAIIEKAKKEGFVGAHNTSRVPYQVCLSLASLDIREGFEDGTEYSKIDPEGKSESVFTERSLVVWKDINSRLDKEGAACAEMTEEKWKEYVIESSSKLEFFPWMNPKTKRYRQHDCSWFDYEFYEGFRAIRQKIYGNAPEGALIRGNIRTIRDVFCKKMTEIQFVAG